MLILFMELVMSVQFKPLAQPPFRPPFQILPQSKTHRLFLLRITGRQSLKVGAVGSRDAEIGGEVVVTSRYGANALGTVCPSKLHGGAH